MKKDLFNDIKSRIADRVPEIKTFGLFNNQFNNEKNVNAFQFPCVFLEFGNIGWLSQSKGIQQGETLIRLHIGFETYKTDNNSNRIDQSNSEIGFLDLVSKIHVAINGFDGEYFNPLLRVSEQQNTDHDNVLVWVAEYRTMITDDGAETRYSKPLVKLDPPIDVNIDLI